MKEIKMTKLIEKYALFFYILLSFFITFIVYKDFIIGDYAYFFKDIGSDSLNAGLPNYISGSYLSKTEGTVSTWSFFSGMGQRTPLPFTLNPISYIIRFLFYLFGYKLYFYNVYLNYFFFVLPTGIFAYLYFKTLKYSGLTAIVGALLITFSGYMTVGGQWGHSYKIMNFVFLMFAFEQLLIKKRWGYFLIAFYLLSDNAFLMAANVIFLFFYSIVRFIDVQKNGFAEYIRLIAKMIGTGLLGIALNAPRVVTFFMTMYESPRVSGTVNLSKQLFNNPETIDTKLRNITTTLRFFANDLLGAGSNFNGWYNYLEAALFYIGSISLILALLAFVYYNKKQKIVYGLFFSFWMLVAFVPILRHAINFFIGNYFKNTIDIFVPFTLLFFAMFALDNIFKNKKINPILLVFVSGTLLLILNFPYTKDIYINSNMKLIISLFIIANMVIIFLFSIKKINALKYLLIIITMIELSYVSWSSVNDRNICTMSELKTNMAGYDDGTIEVVNYIKEIDSSKFYRIEKDYSSGNTEHSSLNDAKAQGYFGTSAYGSFNQNYYVKFLQELNLVSKIHEGQSRWIVGLRNYPLLLTFANIKYFLSKSNKNNLIMFGYDSIATYDSIMILKNKYNLPLGYTYSDYLPFKEFQKLSDFKKQQALLTAVVLEDNQNNFNLNLLDTNNLILADSFSVTDYKDLTNKLKRDTLRIEIFKHKKIQGNISLNSDKFMFFTIPFDKGWEIYVDGNKEKLTVSNIGFFGIFLEKGKHDIILKYKPLYFTTSIIISSFATLIILFLVFLFRAKTKNNMQLS